MSYYAHTVPVPLAEEEGEDFLKNADIYFSERFILRSEMQLDLSRKRRLDLVHSPAPCLRFSIGGLCEKCGPQACMPFELDNYGNVFLRGNLPGQRDLYLLRNDGDPLSLEKQTFLTILRGVEDIPVVEQQCVGSRDEERCEGRARNLAWPVCPAGMNIHPWPPFDGAIQFLTEPALVRVPGFGDYGARWDHRRIYGDAARAACGLLNRHFDNWSISEDDD